MMTYQEQIKHPKWQKKRLEVMKLRKFKCQACGAKEEELHIHHPFYKRGAMIWEYDKTELECLCHRCHKDAHAIDEKIKKALATCKDKEKVLAFILGLNLLEPPTMQAQVKVVPVKKDAAPEEDLSDHERWEEEDLAFFAEYPQYKPCPGDSKKELADKFFAKMRHMFG